MKASYMIEWPDDLGSRWMNADNLMLCLNAYCKGVDLKVTELEAARERVRQVETEYDELYKGARNA